jgi:hypothetical protein
MRRIRFDGPHDRDDDAGPFLPPSLRDRPIMLHPERKLELLREPIERCVASLRALADQVGNDEAWAQLGNLATWLEGVYTDDPRYVPADAAPDTGGNAIESAIRDLVDRVKQEAVDPVIASLNDAFERDPAAIHALLCNRVPCNGALGDHPHVVCERSLSVPGTVTVGAFGLVNGVLLALDLAPVAIKWSDDVDAEGRYRLLGFCIHTSTVQESEESRDVVPA